MFLPNSCNGQDQRRIHKKWQKFGQSMKIADFADRCICSAWQWIKFLFGNVNMCNREVGVLSSAQKSWLIIMDATFGGSDWEGLTVLQGLKGVNFFSQFYGSRDWHVADVVHVTRWYFSLWGIPNGLLSKNNFLDTGVKS